MMAEQEYKQGIAEWLDKLHFRKQWFGGVSEADVWQKISELNGKYEELLKAERIRYDTLMAQQRPAVTSPEFHAGQLKTNKVGDGDDEKTTT